MLVAKQLTAPIDFHSIFSHIIDVSGYRQHLPAFLKKIHTGLQQLEGE